MRSSACIRAAGCFVLAAVLGLAACRPPRPAVAPPAAPLASDAVLAALQRVPAPPGMEGSGTLRVTVQGRDLPAVTARFAGSPDSGRVSLRPGILPPVLGLWASRSDWEIRLPMMRAVVSDGSDSSTPVRLARLLWYVVCPRDLVADLTAPQFRAAAGRWVLRGRLDRLGDWVRAVEVWSDPAGEGIERWSLWLRSGESALSVAYGRPLLQAAPGSAVAFAAPALGVRGSLTFTQLRSASPQPIPRLPVPHGWARLPADSLLPLLEGFSPPSE